MRYYLKSVPDCDFIQMILWTLPDECQRNVMPRLCTTMDSFLKAVKEYEEEGDEEDEEDVEEQEDQNAALEKEQEDQDFHEANRHLFN